MMAFTEPLHWRSPRFRRYVGLAAVVLTLAVAAADVLSATSYTLPIVYIIPLLFCGWARHRVFLWSLAGLMVLLTVAFHFWGVHPSHQSPTTISLVNRGLSAAVILLIAGLLQVSIVTEESLERQREMLEKQNAELETVNQELSQREEEIVRQNEELQSQTEELERQSEELRITNEELANREKTLENLLDLSRSLTAELDRDEVFKRICEALNVLGNGKASAILEKRGDELRLLCHHGFEPSSKTFPLEHSFTSLILARGQTGYLEDLQLRPDLQVPRPNDGSPFRSVLSAPMRVHSRLVGTIELYAHQPKSWSDAQIAIIESLAAQASISLQSAELIEAIRRERRRFEAAFRTVPFGMAVAEDAAGKQVRFNPAAAALFNVPLDENVALSTVTGARLRRYLFRNDRPLSDDERPLYRALRGEEVHHDEVEVVLPGGKRHWLLCSAAPIYDTSGRIAGAVSGFTDVLPLKTALRELELRRREAEEANTRKTRFLAAVSHDIRTPANAINLMAEILSRMAGNPAMVSQVPEMAQKLRTNALSLISLVSEVLDLARFDSGKVDLQETEFPLQSMIEQEVEHMQLLAQEKGLQIIVESLDAPVWLRTDRVKLGRILGNLLGNAIKFTERGEIHVQVCQTPERTVEIRIRDTGIGIAPDQIPRIFDEFAQLRNPERDSSKGTGLGLAICRRLVDVMGGSIKVESQLGLGSTFTVTLPPSCLAARAQTPADAPGINPCDKPPAEPDALKGLRILLVEDHGTTREGVARILREDGATVVEAATGAAALGMLGHDSVDVLLLDMMLPDLDGREILVRLRHGRPPDLRAVIVMTGDLTDGRQTEVGELGADALFAKPVNVRDLVEALKKLKK